MVTTQMMGVSSTLLARGSSMVRPSQQEMLLGVALILWTDPSFSLRMESQWVRVC